MKGGGHVVPNKLIVKHGLEANLPSLLQYGELASTNTGKLFVGNSAGKPVNVGSPGKKVCRFVVGTSTAGWTADDCDFLCDGTADQIELQAAIDSLPSGGGEIVILDGTYNITATIKLNKQNIKLKGSGISTKLLGNVSGTVSRGFLYCTSSYCSIEDLSISSPSILSNLYGIYVSNSSYCSILNNFITNFDKGIFISQGDYLLVSHNAVSSCKSYNIQLVEGEYTRITGNICIGQGTSIGSVRGISVSYGTSCIITENFVYNTYIGIPVDSSPNSQVSGNIVHTSYTGSDISGSSNYCTVTDNTYVNCLLYGIESRQASHQSISNNMIVGSGTTGLYMMSSYSVVSENVIYKETYSSSQYSLNIYSSATNNLFANNMIWGKNYVNNGTNNTFVNNKYN